MEKNLFELTRDVTKYLEEHPEMRTKEATSDKGYAAIIIGRRVDPENENAEELTCCVMGSGGTLTSMLRTIAERDDDFYRYMKRIVSEMELEKHIAKAFEKTFRGNHPRTND